jgi:hypothetical protein
MDIEQKRKHHPFVNLAEVEFARLLSFYRIEWQYEPHSFPLRWQDGRVVQMFTPDFYLPEYDLYIELTTMKQKLVTRKNRKMRLLRAVYPDINIKLLYRKDFQRLFGLFGTSFIEDATSPSPISGEGWGGGNEEVAV